MYSKNNFQSCTSLSNSKLPTGLSSMEKRKEKEKRRHARAWRIYTLALVEEEK